MEIALIIAGVLSLLIDNPIFKVGGIFLVVIGLIRYGIKKGK